MDRKSVAKPKVGCVRTTHEVWKRFIDLTNGWKMTHGQAFERLVTQAEHRNTRTPKGEKDGL